MNDIEIILNEPNKRKQYKMILEYLYLYAFEKFKNNNYCDFVNNQCIANRLGKSVHKSNGCCYQHKKGLCKYLVNNSCSIECISCQLFMCDYLQKKIKSLEIDKIFPLKKVFNKKQRDIIKYSFFKKKEEILELLISNQ